MTSRDKGGKRLVEDPWKTSSSPFALPPSAFALSVSFIAVVLSWMFWGPLWEGGTLIGGDLFPYFFPQKVFLADQLRTGVIPLWNPLTGDGYPTIAESQTGVCYPPDLLAYRLLSVSTAYNAVQIAHYIFGFCGTWLFVRRLGATTGGALLAAISFTYGWFPARICLEWAIVSGAYFPWILWCAESYLQQPRRRFFVGLCVLLALQLLAGHFHLAFITQLVLAIYAPARWWSAATRRLGAAERSAPETLRVAANREWIAVWGAIGISFCLAAVQVLPTWELKQRSQRSEISAEHQPGYGHLPPRYWTQVFGPWVWYTGNIDQSLNQMPHYAGGAGTNQAEAHLYFGLIPLALALLGWSFAFRGPSGADRLLLLWLFLGLIFLLYTPGWCLPIAQHLPGFNFFRGPGRYGIVTSLAVAVTAGLTFSRLLERLPRSAAGWLAGAICAVTVAELWWVAQLVGYSRMLPVPIVERRSESPARQMLAKEEQPVRLFAPMPNVANLLDASSTPVYLGIGPAEYFDPRYTLPASPTGGLNPQGDAAQLAWLNQAGVTHILAQDRMNSQAWPLELIWSGPDPLLTSVFGRSPQEPFYLYRLKTGTGRVVWEIANSPATVTIEQYAAQRVEIRCDSSAGGRVVLRDLDYPGWRVSLDGHPAPAERAGMFRAVTVEPGPHQIVWSYQPASVRWGAIISGATGILLIAGIAASRRDRPARTNN